MASNNEDDVEGYFGPELPPNMSSQLEIGPQIPSHFRTRTNNEEPDEDMEEFVKQITAQIPQEEDLYGPMPCTDSDEIRKESVIKEIEGRAAKTKQLLLEGKKEVLKREAWMTELPPQLSGAVGLCERRFKTSNTVINTDRSVWTDTPADKERKMHKSDDKDKAKNNNFSPLDGLIQAKNTEQRQMVADYEKKNDRSKSLFELHSEKLKKKRKRSSSSSSSSSSSEGRRSKKHKKKDKKDKKNKKVAKEPTRRPFDRNVDLQAVNLLDSTQRQALMKRSKELNSKFMHGKSHYL